MKKELIGKRAHELIGLGYTRQHVYDMIIAEHPTAKPKRVADVVRYIPPITTRDHLRAPQQALLAVILTYAVLEIARRVIDIGFDRENMFDWFRVMPIATVFLGFAIFKWKGEAYGWLAFFNLMSGLGILKVFMHAKEGTIDPWDVTAQVLSLIIAGLAWYISEKAFKKYTVEKDPNAIMPPRITFAMEPGVQWM